MIAIFKSISMTSCVLIVWEIELTFAYWHDLISCNLAKFTLVPLDSLFCFFYIDDLLSVNRRILFFPFQPVCLFVQTRTTTVVSNRSGENGYPCIVPYLRGKMFCFSLLSMMLAVASMWGFVLGFVLFFCKESVHFI